MKMYTVKYKEFEHSKVGTTFVLANSKAEAYDKAVYEKLPYEYECNPYSAWVAAVTYNNGNYKEFNTFEGKPY